MVRPSEDSWNIYITFLLYAIYGRMREADAVGRRHRASIAATASWLRAAYPISPTEVYRGLLLEPEDLHGRPGHWLVAAYQPNLTFVSTSEEEDVACWFATPESAISGAVSQARPRTEGYIARFVPALKSILWHYTWRELPVVPGRPPLPLVEAALVHPDIADVQQFAWNLLTQKEVILKPFAPGDELEVTPLADAGCPPAEQLDAELLPPWLEGAY